jgi:nucleotide-binding universal stress UspA family protein
MAYDEIFEKPGWERARLLDDAVARLKQRAPDLQIIPALLEGRPKDVILDEAEQWGADLIVVGSNGYGTIKRLFLGSVSLAVALNAPCSVEIVRPPSSVPNGAAPVTS